VPLVYLRICASISPDRIEIALLQTQRKLRSSTMVVGAAAMARTIANSNTSVFYEHEMFSDHGLALSHHLGTITKNADYLKETQPVSAGRSLFERIMTRIRRVIPTGTLEATTTNYSSTISNTVQALSLVIP
jgi:cyclophilin family peptidyl-prolyl cis-trans isomerase